MNVLYFLLRIVIGILSHASVVVQSTGTQSAGSTCSISHIVEPRWGWIGFERLIPGGDGTPSSRRIEAVFPRVVEPLWIQQCPGTVTLVSQRFHRRDCPICVNMLSA